MSTVSTVTSATFASLTGNIVKMTSPDGAELDVTVLGARDKPSTSPEGAARTAFSVFLMANGNTDLDEGDYILSGEGVPELGLLHIVRIVPRNVGTPTAEFAIYFN